MDPYEFSDERIRANYRFAERAEEAVKSGRRVVLLLDNPRDLAFAVHLHRLGSPGFLIIVSSPAASWELEKRGIPHTYLNRYFDVDGERITGYENFARLDAMCEEIDRAFFESNPVIVDYQFRVSRNFFPYIKILYDGIVFRIDVVKEILDRERPDVIVTVKNETSFFTDSGEPPVYPFARDDSIFSLILELNGWPCRSIQVVRGPVLGSIRPAVSPTASAIVPFLLPNISLYSFARIVRILGAGNAITGIPRFIVNRLRNGKTLLFTSYSMEWQKMIPHLSRKGYRLLFLNEFAANSTADRETSGPAGPDIRKYCIRKGTDFSPIVEKKILPLLRRVAYDFIRYHGAAEQLIADECPLACIGNVDTYLGRFFVVIAQRHAIPKVTWQHGTTGYVRTPIFIYEELINSKYYLVWGPGVTRMYADLETEFPNDTRCTFVPAGSMTLRGIFEAAARGAPVSPVNRKILYGTMSYYHNTLNFGFDHRFDDIEMWQAQKEILAFLASLPCGVVLKLHPGEKEDYQVREFIRDRKAENIEVIKTERKFSELALEAEIIILDCPSTIFLEALAAKKTVFALFEFLLIPDKARGLLAKRAFISYSRRELLEQVRKYLAGEPMDQHPDNNDTGFLEYYGFPRDSGSVPETVTGILEDIRR